MHARMGIQPHQQMQLSIRWSKFDAAVPIDYDLCCTFHSEPPASKDRGMCLAFVRGMSPIKAFHNRNWCRCTQVAGLGGQVKGASLLSRFW